MSGTNDVITLIVIGGVLLYAYEKGMLQPIIDQVNQFMGSIGGAITPAPGGGGGGAPAPGGGGGISTSGSCVGTELQPDHQGSSKRWESGDIPGDPEAYEVTWCGEFSGDDLTFKMYGPSHSGSACCWCVMHVKEDGSMVAGGEGPHPSSNCEHAESSQGSGGVAPCYKATVRPGPVQEGYALVNGQWELRASYSGPCGCDEQSSTKSGNTLMVRNDGSITTQCASVNPLGGVAAAYARAMYSARQRKKMTIPHLMYNI